MIRKLHLQNFKNFRDATLSLGRLTLLVGANASGKTNLIDAFRFLHGVARGYSLAEIIGEKWGDAGYLEWPGIRGGTREICYRGEHEFAVEVTLDDPKVTYHIAVELVGGGRPALHQESLHGARKWRFSANGGRRRAARSEEMIEVTIDTGAGAAASRVSLDRHQPVLAQLTGRDRPSLLRSQRSAKPAAETLSALSSMRFFDFSPEALRRPSLPGQDVLGASGENLSSTLQAICADRRLKRAALEWLQALTPMDVIDFEFVDVGRGEISLSLVEASGQRTSVYSASDGTLRFLGVLAALTSPKRSQTYFFEEIENAIHPTRLHLLLQLLEQQVSRDDVQVVATTHAPHLLGLLNRESLESAVLTYRLEGHPDAHVQRIVDLPEARQIIEEQNLARLHEAGWLENSIAFQEAETNST